MFVVKATGEVFRTYEAYLKQMELYNTASWSCRYTGKGGLTLEEAQEAEHKAVAALQSVSLNHCAPELLLPRAAC